MPLTFRWLTPPAPAALALVRLAPVHCLDRALPEPGRARFARLLAPGGAVVDEVVAQRLEDGALELSCHGGSGVRAAATAAFAAWGLAEDAAPAGDGRWQRLARAAHPAAAAWLLAHPAGAPPFPAAFLERCPLVLIAGPVNAGKSTLLNAWCGHDRALVSERPGTTRDLVAAEVLAGGWRLRLLDSAGERRTGDALERAGQELALQARARADLVLYLAGSGGDRAQAGDLVVRGKADLEPAPGPLDWSYQGAHGRPMHQLLAAVVAAVLDRLGLTPAGLPAAAPP